MKATVGDYNKLEENKPLPAWEVTPLSLSDRETLILKHSPLVRYAAQRLVRRLPNHIALEDLIRVGMIGLMDAIQKFDPGKKVNFSTYAEYRIRGAMLDELRAMDWVPREEGQDPAFQIIQMELKKNLAEAIDRLTQREKTFLSLYYYEELTGREIGHILGCSEGRVSQIHSEVRSKLRTKLT